MGDLITAGIIPESWGVRPEISATFQNDMFSILVSLGGIILAGWLATRVVRTISLMRQGETRWNSRAVWRSSRP